MEALTIEPRLEPREQKNQARINRLYDMREAEIEISACLKEYKPLFPQEIQNFLEDVRMAIWDYEQEDEE